MTHSYTARKRHFLTSLNNKYKGSPSLWMNTSTKHFTLSTNGSSCTLNRVDKLLNLIPNSALQSLFIHAKQRIRNLKPLGKCLIPSKLKYKIFFLDTWLFFFQTAQNIVSGRKSHALALNWDSVPKVNTFLSFINSLS